MKNLVLKFVRVTSHPVHMVVEYLHVKQIITVVHHKRTAKIVIGVGLMVTGSAMAAYPIAIVPHILWDAMAYGLHGYGALPIIRVACKKLDLDDID